MWKLSKRCNFLVKKERHTSNTMMTSCGTHFLRLLTRRRAETCPVQRRSFVSGIAIWAAFSFRVPRFWLLSHPQPSQPDKGGNSYAHSEAYSVLHRCSVRCELDRVRRDGRATLPPTPEIGKAKNSSK